MKVGIELFQWLNNQMDLNSSKVDLVDGFIFMLRRIHQHGSIRLVGNQQIHPRFWRTHDRAFGYQLMGKRGSQKSVHLYQFYVHVAFNERFIMEQENSVVITEAGLHYLSLTRDEQLQLLFSYIW